jgi:site-specific DNA-methyltransferase (adenine-specific)
MAKYTLHHGDCVTVLRSFQPETVDLIVTSPPYNCRKEYGDFDDMLPWPQYYQWFNEVLKELYRVLVPGGVIAINVPGVVRWQANHRHADTWSDFDPSYSTHRDGEKVMGKGRIEPVGFQIFEMMRQNDQHVREPIVWVKGSEGNAICSDYRMGCDSDPYMRPAHEFILLGSKSRWFHRGGTGRRGGDAVPFLDETKDVWFIPPERDRLHPAIFPVELPRRLIKLFTHAPDSVVLDPFLGLGSSGVAAMELNREFIGIEQYKKYLNKAEHRIYSVAAQGRMFETHPTPLAQDGGDSPALPA